MIKITTFLRENALILRKRSLPLVTIIMAIFNDNGNIYDNIYDNI